MHIESNQPLPTLVVICKRPKLHQGKQRLAATLGVEQALILANSFLQCALEDARDWPGKVVLSPASADDLDWAALLLDNADIIPQSEGNLGQRLMEVDQQLREAGHNHILYIGTDAPILDSRHYFAAIQAFNRYSVVLSAASDGGVTMMGSRSSWPQIVSLPWSTEHLGEALKAACEAAGLEVGYILPSYDIDVEEDLRRLADDLQHDVRPARKRLLEKLLALTVEERKLCTIR
ncbi:DUF2064 domain-containing protein [Motiliproteus sp. MSK22-1]|uniref:TIGR04282 family arsenosugar biosynthesis glycosyltransferase n=1 Tax=Motiliproteus sp. MSK22-1 TaxID=1897630 RepID=UPI000977EC6F|nr:DUF2064 domain-containing protein [Motiliproteus sp. MSK22-1]OMH32796.1 hypothetical protein BGP75_14830 [Motiliproteus sp. MSK22-1]